jgi:hypothetical protein
LPAAPIWDGIEEEHLANVSPGAPAKGPEDGMGLVSFLEDFLQLQNGSGALGAFPFARYCDT